MSKTSRPIADEMNAIIHNLELTTDPYSHASTPSNTKAVVKLLTKIWLSCYYYNSQTVFYCQITGKGRV